MEPPIPAAAAAASGSAPTETKSRFGYPISMISTLRHAFSTSPASTGTGVDVYMLYDSGCSCVVGIFNSLENAKTARRTCTVGTPPRRVELVDSWVQRVRLNQLFDGASEDPDVVDGPGEQVYTS